MTRKPVYYLAICLLLLSSTQCNQVPPSPTGPSTESLIQTTAPAWVTASWSGGARGRPNDHKGHPVTSWNGNICQPSFTYPWLDNWSRNPGHLTIFNNCGIFTVSFALCVSKGSLSQPAGGLRQCATDPLKTSFSQLTFLSLENGDAGFWYPSTGNFSVNVFWCGSDDQLTVWGGEIGCM